MGGDIVFAYGLLFYLALILIAVPRHPFRRASLLAFAAFAAMYLSFAFDAQSNQLGLVLYVGAGGLAYLATPGGLRVLAVAAFASWTPALRFFSADPFAAGYPVSDAIASILAVLFVSVVLLMRDAAVDDERIRRAGLGLLAVATLTQVSERHYLVASPGVVAPDDLVALVVVAVLPILVIARIRVTTRDALATAVALTAYTLVGVALILGKGYHVDSVVAVHRAAELVVAGRDPYQELDIAEALRHFGLDPTLATNFEDGSVVATYSYPALSFLVPAPFVALGLRDLRFLYLGEIVVLGLLVIRRTRVPWRPLVLAAIVGNAIITRQSILAGVDPLWAVFTLLAFLYVGRRWSSPILIGLACATRQPAWFFVPFYLVAVWKREGRREALRRAAVAVVAGTIPNLPFLIVSPGSFLGGILLPTLGPLEPYGIGLVRFAMDGQIPLFARGVYGALSIAAMAAFIVVLWRWWRRLPSGALVFPTVALWFAWRSLQNYFSFAGVFAIAADEAVAAADAPAEPVSV
jgi:hypothetical protein